MKSTVIPNFIAKNLKLGRSKTMLICYDKAERHLADRCLRQFGMPQPIPEDVHPWERKNRGVDGGVDLSGKMESELMEWLDRQYHIVQCDNGVEETDYMQWYSLITRKFVGRPISLSTEFRRTTASLRHIADIADTFDMEGLDPQQIDSITRIRYIARECLRDQVQSPITVSAIPKLEPRKRARGEKDSVGRKNNEKLMQKHVLIPCHAANDDAHFQFSGVVPEADTGDVNNFEFCYVDSKINGPQFFRCDSEDDNTNNMVDSQFCDSYGMVNERRLDAVNQFEESKLCDASKKVDDTQIFHVTEASDPQLPHATIMEVTPHSSPEASEIVVFLSNDSKLHDNGIDV